MQTINGVNVYTLTEIAELIGISYTTALSYVNKGIIPAAKTGRGWLITEQSLMRYLNGETHVPLKRKKRSGNKA